MIGTSVLHYRIEDQLGKGGMGVVYRATDTQLDRTVALKFLPPHLSADDDAKRRFVQEAKAASALDHANICSIHHIGETADGKLFIVMSYYEGETLKYLIGDRRLEVDEAVSIAKQVAAGLQRAHDAGIVHRDIKPANIMVTSRGEVKILDFGVAKLSTSNDLTAAGSTVGTAAYMSPEQARGDKVGPASDLWAVGVLLFEMLTGKRPFDAEYDQALVYSIMNEPAPDVRGLRPDVPDEVADVVMKLLSKEPAARFANAVEVIRALGGSTGTLVSARPTEAPGAAVAAAAPSAIGVLSVFAGVAVVLLGLIYGAMLLFGLPDWVFPLGVILVLAGAPVLAYASRAERKRADLDSAERKALSGLAQWLTVRKAVMGGVYAMAGLGLISGGFMLMRALGIGPAATLLSSGVFDTESIVVVADFDDKTNGNLGRTVADALRIDLGQSNVVRIMSESDVAATLERMERPEVETLDDATAREVAQRAGAKAVLVGDIAALGSSYVISLRLVDAQSGSELLTARESAAGESDIVAAVDRLSAQLREEIGESLVSIRASAPLESVTTVSLEALRLYSRAMVARDHNRHAEVLRLLEEAVRLDSNFAMAYLGLAVNLNNSKGSLPLRIKYATKAYELRHRLPDLERFDAEIGYFTWVQRSLARRSEVARAKLERYPDDYRAINTLHLAARYSGRVDESIELAYRLQRLDPSRLVGFHNAFNSLARTDRWVEAAAMLDSIRAKDPAYSTLRSHGLVLLGERDRNYLAVLDSARAILREPGIEAALARDMFAYAVGMSLMHGFVADADRFIRERLDFELKNADAETALDEVLSYVPFRFQVTGDREASEALLRDVVARLDWASLDSVGRPYAARAYAEAILGHPDAAKEVLNEQLRYTPPGWLVEDSGVEAATAMVAFAEGRFGEAADRFRRSRSLFTIPRIREYEMAMALRADGRAQDALMALESMVRGTGYQAMLYDNGVSTLAYRALGELYEEAGRNDDAVAAYTEFLNRWKNADSALLPQVAEVRQRVTSLVEAGAREPRQTVTSGG